ncbi:HesB/IscA family protein [Ampullimonas aquatilis]|uniref:HesB/IscA family protein n=1 Tax=Ampullimonas aquatilis TaxID=1341549 RepID=UPI003C7933B6
MIPNLTINPAAEKFIRRMVRFSDHPEGGFRLTVSPGGCSGYSSEFTVEAAPREGDATMNVNGVNLYLPAESRLMLEGITIGFEDTPTKSGLTFFNPNAASCACSSSGDSASAPSVVSTVDISALRAH